jgi:sulfur relay protein TusB/DsrH
MGGEHMRLGFFVSDFTLRTDILDRMKAENLGLIFVANGVYHASMKVNGKASGLLERTDGLYVLSEDLETRGITESDVDQRVKVVTYGDLVDLIFNEFEKVAWT